MQSRNLGLDIIRTFAITVVIISHLVPFLFPGYFIFTPVAYVLGMGVELFFALSGFLIGGILIRDVVENRQGVGAIRRLLLFYVRRWMRTLPLYYTMIIIILLFVGTSLPGHTTVPSFDPLNLVFLQNFSVNALSFQPVSWSLTIEEWFYLLIPLGMIAISFFKRNRANLIYAYCLVVIVASLLIRTYNFQTHQPFWNMWDYGTRKQIFVHMDSLMFGVLFATIKLYHRQFYLAICKNWLFILAIIGILCYGLFKIYTLVATQEIDYSKLAHTYLFSLIGLSCAGVVAIFDVLIPTGRPGFVTAMFRHISVHSYAYYLIHWYVLIAFSTFVVPFNVAQNALLALFALLLIASIAYFEYDMLEHPMLALRDRLFSSKPSTSQLVFLETPIEDMEITVVRSKVVPATANE